jgi:hypothetical protein
MTKIASPAMHKEEKLKAKEIKYSNLKKIKE